MTMVRRSAGWTLWVILGATGGGALGQATERVSGLEEWSLRTADGEASLYVQERGTGDRVIVLHGGFGAEQMPLWDISRGLEHEHRFMFYDQRGSLRSPCKIEDVSFAKHVEDLETLRGDLQEEKLTIVAHSAGTLLACAYLEKHPENVERLVLIGFAQPKWRFGDEDFPDGKPPFDWDEYPKRIAAFYKRPEIAAELARYNLNQSKSPSGVSTGGTASAECQDSGTGSEGLNGREATARWRIQFAGANLYHVERWRELRGVSHFFNSQAADATKDLFSTRYDFLGAIRSNTQVAITIIVGTHDFCDFGGQMYRALFAKDEHIKVTVIEKAGHMPWIDDREAFRDALRHGLKRGTGK
jgi:pimeloyl-ACP methyl ester carboxylesterase